MTRSPNFRSARCTRSNFSQREMPRGNVQIQEGVVARVPRRSSSVIACNGSWTPVVRTERLALDAVSSSAVFAASARCLATSTVSPFPRHRHSWSFRTQDGKLRGRVVHDQRPHFVLEVGTQGGLMRDDEIL